EPTPAESGTPAVTTTVAQKTCPIMGKEINESISTEYKGQKVYFCCPPCVDKFKADPEKYVKDLPQFEKQ
ncbi:MAG: YHS domain-containing protein, partial [Planctomycetota bacterium]